MLCGLFSAQLSDLDRLLPGSLCWRFILSQMLRQLRASGIPGHWSAAEHRCLNAEGFAGLLIIEGLLWRN